MPTAIRSRALILAALSVSALVVGCDPDDGAVDLTGSCCGRAPARITGDGFAAYVPNAFTPNGDGVNDRFAPVVDTGITAVGFDVYDVATGEPVYSTERRYPTAELADVAWDGRRADGSAYVGTFEVLLDLRVREGFTVSERALSCAIDCADALARADDCVFGSQRAGDSGDYDAARAPGEDSCVGR